MRLLKPGGAILFVGHNYQAAANRLMGLRSPIIDIEHMQIFSPVAMSEMLRRCGFVGTTVHTITNRYPLHYWLKLAPLPRFAKKTLILWLKWTGLGYLPVTLPAGNIAAVAYKPGILTVASQPPGTV